jgi:ABC-type transport system involved in multi-copper enzyme maturation permease subunit
MASGVATVVNWVQRTVPWSNTPRAWTERLALAGLLVAVGVLILCRDLLSIWQNVVAWGVLLVLFGFLLRQGWVFVFGPVLSYDLMRSARRTRTYAIRILYLLLLFGLLCWLYWIWLERSEYRQTTSKDIADFTMMFFATFLSTQLLVVVLLTPAYVAGAISEEKERKTIEYILATDLRNREIVLGKFVARLVNLTVLIMAGLPILSAVQFMGGIDPNLLLAGFAGTGLTMLSIASISIFASTVCRRTRDAIIIVYMAILTYFGGWAVTEAAFAYFSAPVLNSPAWLLEIMAWVVYPFRAGNPIYAIAQTMRSGTVLGSVVWSELEQYAIFHGLLSAAGIVGSVALLRRCALSQPRPAKGRTWFGLGRKRRLPKIGNYPMIWKEVFAERGIRLHLLLRILFILLFILSVVPLIFIFIYTFDEYDRRFYGGSLWEQLGHSMNVYVRSVGMLVGLLGLIGVAVRSATSVRSEREKDTFDAILTSPMSSEEILFGKWLGSIASVRWVFFWLIAIWILGIVTGGVNVLMFPLLCAAWLVYAAAAASLGLWYSVISRSSLRAIMATLFTGLLITCGHWIMWMCCVPVFASSGPRGAWEDAISTLAQMEMGITPPVVLSLLPFRTEELVDYRDRSWAPVKLIIFCMGGTFCWSIFAVVLWQATNERFKKLTFRGLQTKAERNPMARARSYAQEV